MLCTRLDPDAFGAAVVVVIYVQFHIRREGDNVSEKFTKKRTKDVGVKIVPKPVNIQVCEGTYIYEYITASAWFVLVYFKQRQNM